MPFFMSARQNRAAQRPQSETPSEQQEDIAATGDVVEVGTQGEDADSTSADEANDFLWANADAFESDDSLTASIKQEDAATGAYAAASSGSGSHGGRRSTLSGSSEAIRLTGGPSAANSDCNVKEEDV
ncbi:hypothetical protein GGG16DRAFT_119499 [Schizophyllum commune]